MFNSDRSQSKQNYGLLRKLQHVLSRQALITIDRYFIRLCLGYTDILYHKALNESFHQEIKSIQYNACLATTGAIRDNSKQKNYQELGLEQLQNWRWFGKLCYFYKICNEKSPDYLFQSVPSEKLSCTARKVDNIPFFKFRHNFFKSLFFSIHYY